MASARGGFRSTLPYGAVMRHAKLSRRGCWLPLIGLCLGLAATGALGQSCKYDSIPATAPASRFTDKSDGRVTDTATGLTWTLGTSSASPTG